MFNKYQIAIENAQKREQDIVNDYSNQREAHSLQQQKIMDQEATNMRSGQSLKDYNPTVFVNELTRMKHEFDALGKDEQKDLNEVKQELDGELHKLTDFPIKEICKYIGCDTNTSANNYRYMCRVWFTLVSIPEFSCVPGDPIRVEWVDMVQQHVDRRNNGITCSAKRTGPGLEGLKIPNFHSAASPTSVNNFYPIDNWGTTSNVKNWWIDWVKVNRPMPE